MTAPNISPLPDAPTRADSPTEFNNKAFALVDSLQTMVSQMSAVIGWMNTNVNVNQPITISGTSADISAEYTGAYIRATNALPKEITILPDSEEPQMDGAYFFIVNRGAGDLTMVEGDGVTINHNVITAENGACIIQRVSTNVYDFVPIGGEFLTDLSDLEAEVSTAITSVDTFEQLRGLVAQTRTVFVNDDGGHFKLFSGQPPGTYVDNGTTVIVPTGVDGSAAWLRISVSFNNGSESVPSINFTSDTDTGIYRKAPNSLALTTGGTDRIVLTSAGRTGIGTESPSAKTHVVNGSNATPNAVTCGLRVTSYWQGGTATPYQNNDCSLLEVFNDVQSDSLNLSWGVSAANSYNNIPVGVTDSGNRVGVYGWAVSTPVTNYSHAGTLEFQFGVWGRAGFLAPGSPTTGVINNAIGVRGDIVADSAGATIENAVAGEFTSTASTGEVTYSYAVRASASGANSENWSFHGDAGDFFNQDQAFFGSKFSEMDSSVSARGTGNRIEFGFPTAGGYGCSLGAMPSSGNPFIALCAKVDAVTDTFTTNGQLGFVIQNNLSADALIFSRLTNTSGTGLTPSEMARFDLNGRLQLQGTPIIPGFTPASSTATGQTGQISWDSDYFYVCVGTNSWIRFAKAAW